MKKKLPALENVPEEFSFVEATARQYADTFENLKKYYEVGYKAAANF